MNEKLNELRLDAGIARIDQQWLCVVGKETGMLIDPVIGLEKFAELIIKECINELEVSKKVDPYTGEVFECEYNLCISEQILTLKEHFGVE